MNGPSPNLRPATHADAEFLLRLRNDEVVRAHSFQTAEVASDEHAAWLERKLASPDDSRLYIAELDGAPVAQARIDRLDATSGEISVAVDGAVRHGGIGRAVIRLASERASAELGLSRIVARIKPANEPSLRAFRHAGYVDSGREERSGEAARLMAWTRAREAS